MFKMFKTFKPNIGRFKVPGSKFKVQRETGLLHGVPIVPNVPAVLQIYRAS